MSYLRVHEITKVYPSGTTALEQVSFSMERRDRMAIVGPSGCGKTTLLNLVAGIDQPTSGSVTIDGQPATTADASRVVVFQADAVFPWLTVEANVAYPLRIQGMKRSQAFAAARQTLKRVGLEDFATAWPRELSGGMRKRVDLARAYAMDVEMILLDEPFASLDTMTRLDIQDVLLASLDSRSLTSLLITHDIDEAILFSNNVVILSARPGRLVAQVPVTFSWPRDTSLRLTEEFNVVRRKVSSFLGLRTPEDPSGKHS